MLTILVRLSQSVATQSLIQIQLTYVREFNRTIQHRIHADLGDGKYIVEVGSLKLWRGHRTKRMEMDTSDVDPQIHSQWHEWWESQEDPVLRTLCPLCNTNRSFPRNHTAARLARPSTIGATVSNTVIEYNSADGSRDLKPLA